MVINVNDEQGIDLLHLIFERELMPPFRLSKVDVVDHYKYYNKNGEYVGRRWSSDVVLLESVFYHNIRYKVCQVFEFSCDTWDWWWIVKPYLLSWIDDQIKMS